MANTGAPSFEITLGGKSLTGSTLKYLLSAEFKESINAIDSLTIKMVVPEDPSEVVDLAKPGTAFIIKLGQGSSQREVHGSIVEVSHARSTSAPWVITLQGLDKFHELKKKRARKVRKGSDDAAIKEIAGECGLTPEVEAVDPTGDYSLQLNEDYGSYLLRIAQEHDYLVRIEEGKTLRFARRSTAYQASSVTLKWGEQIESISLRYSLNGVVTGVKVKGYDYTKSEWVSGEAKASDLQCISGGDTGADLAEAEYGAMVQEIDNSKVNSTSKAKGLAKSTLQQAANSFLSGTVQCTGIPDAISGAKLTIEGAGWPLSGDFVIRETTHTLDPQSGYRTTISFYSDSLPPEG